MTHTSSRRAGYAAVLGGCLMLCPREARADAVASRLHLRYEVPAGCPSRQELLAALDARIHSSWVDGSDTRSFDVRVAAERGGGFLGRLEIHQPDRPPSVREIHGESCKAVTTSLAVFIAIAVDPESNETGPDQAPLEGGEPKPPETTDEVMPPAPPAPPTPPASHRPEAPLPLAHPRPRTTWTWRTGYALSYVQSPRLGWGHRVHAELAWGDERRFIPALRLSWGWADFSTLPPLAGEARFRRKSVRLEGCTRFGFPPLAVSACAGLDAGTLTATVTELPRSLHVTTAWSAATATLRAAWAIAPWLELEAASGLLVPFDRPSYTVQEPRRLVYRAPIVLVEGMVGLAVAARFQ